MKKLGIIFTLVAIIGLGTLAFAGNGNGGPGGKGNSIQSNNGGQGNTAPDPMGLGPGFKQMGFGFMLGNLSEEDREALLELRDAFRLATEDIRQDIHGTWEELRSALHEEEVDLATVETLLKELYDLKYEFAQMRIDHMLEMKALVGNFGEVVTIIE
ncbi:MAG: periplasmic heavy metal sensor [Desulfobacterium sp.]|nr:periplasmic heavy metal sensor [Desulfobacterium sp.]